MRKTEQIIGRLSEAERRSLRALRGARTRRISTDHEAKLIGLGLAERVGATPDLTHAGHRALAMIGSW